MPIKQEGSNVVVTGHIAGSVFPTNEKDTVFPVLVDGSEKAARIEGVDAVQVRTAASYGTLVQDWSGDAPARLQWRWRLDKPVEEADDLATLQALLA